MNSYDLAILSALSASITGLLFDLFLRMYLILKKTFKKELKEVMRNGDGRYS